MLFGDDERVYAFTRRHEQTELLVLGNFSGDPAAIELPAAGTARAAGDQRGLDGARARSRGRRACCGAR